MTQEPNQAGGSPERRVARPSRRRSRSAAGPPPARPAAERSRRADPPELSSGPADSSNVPHPSDAAPTAGLPERVEAAEPGPDRRGRGPARTKRSRRDGGRGAHPDGANDGPWRELTGSGRSQVSQAAALRARDAYRPTAEDLARAEHDVVIQRRNWTPGS